MSTATGAPQMTATGQPSAEEREQALRRIKQRRDLAGHAVSYLVVNAAVWIVWALTGSGYPWPAWITGIWAIGLVTNAWDVYMRSPVTEADVQAEIRRMHAKAQR